MPAKTPSSSPVPKGFSLSSEARKVARTFSLLREFTGLPYLAGDAARFNDAVQRHMHVFPGQAVMAASLEPILEGQTLTEDTIKGAIMRIRQNMACLQAGNPIPVWRCEGSIWAWCRVTDMRQFTAGKDAKGNGKPYYEIRLRAYTGITAGEYHTIMLPPRYLKWLMVELGYPRFGPAPQPLGFFNMRLNACLGCNSRGRVILQECEAGPAQRSWNSRLAAARLDHRRCSTPNTPCGICRRGLTECQLACRRETLIPETMIGPPV